MTLILTATASNAICQVTDRLVTRVQPRERFDPLANKNVIFLARDGLVTLGYTGLAYLEGEPTDRWIARKLALDEGLQDDGTGSLRTGFGLPERWLDVGQALGRLAADLADLWRRDGRPPGGLQLQASGFQWRASGWNWNLDRCRPVIWRILPHRSRPEFAALSFERYWGWERRRINVAATPGGFMDDATLSSLARDLASAETTGDVLDRMVVSIRDVACQEPLVGADCMCIHLPSPRYSRTVTSRYVPAPETAGQASKVAFTPWVVAPDVTVAPTISNGFALEVPSGPFSFRFEGPDELQVEPDGRIILFQPQPRPSLPSR